MPKIIKNLRDQITAACLDLFCRHSYESVEMKMIARDCGVAVGTLYNYYDSKWDIFFEVLNSFWTEIIATLDEINHLSLDDGKKLSRAIEFLDGSLISHSALSVVFFDPRGLTDDHQSEINLLYKEVIQVLESLLEPFGDGSDPKPGHLKNRLAEHILLAVTYFPRNGVTEPGRAETMAAAMIQLLSDPGVKSK